jgi:tryptophanyl-tRNA synthetase
MFFKNKEEQKKLTKRMAVYISDKYQQIIIARLHENEAGIIYEQENCVNLDSTVSTLDLGTEVINSLNLYSLKKVNLRENKLTDWPAFKHSKSKSVRAFKQEYIYIFVESCNEFNLVLEMKGFPNKKSELTINSTISFQADKDEIGKKIMNIYEACLTNKI